MIKNQVTESSSKTENDSCDASCMKGFLSSGSIRIVGIMVVSLMVSDESSRKKLVLCSSTTKTKNYELQRLEV